MHQKNWIHLCKLDMGHVPVVDYSLLDIKIVLSKRKAFKKPHKDGENHFKSVRTSVFYHQIKK